MEIKAVDKHNEKMDGMNQSIINGKSPRFFRKDQEKEEDTGESLVSRRPNRNRSWAASGTP